MRSYDWWQTRLADEFFGPDKNGTPVLFFIDKQEQERLHNGTIGIEALGPAVSAELDWRKNPFWPILDRITRWRRTGQEDPPPCLPLLAACVLAATEVQRAAQAGAPPYYVRLAEVLKPSYGSAPNEDFLKNGYEDVVECWDNLSKWLSVQGGSRGLNTAHATKGRERIGYAQSQALVRASDRDALTAFFRLTDTSKRNVPISEPKLLRDLRMWSGKKSLSPRLREALDTRADDVLLGPLLVSLVGSTHITTPLTSRETLKELKLRLAADEDPVDGWQLHWHAATVEGISADMLKYSQGELTVKAQDGYTSYILSGRLPDPALALSHGFSARGSALRVSISAGRHVIALREDFVAGAWVEVSELTTFEPYVFIIDRSGEQRMQTFLHHAGLPWGTPQETSADGWYALPQVEFADDGLLGRAFNVVGLSGTSHTPSRRPRLDGGLRVRLDSERSNYLVGGEPDAILPALPAGMATLLDESPLAGDLEARISLRGRDLKSGPHTIKSPNGDKSFELHNPAEPRQLPEIDITPLSGISDQAIKVRVVGDSFFIRADGTFIPVPGTRLPAWWTRRGTGLQVDGYADINVPDDAVWVVTTGENDRNTIVLLRDIEPAFGHLGEPAREYWTRLVLDQQSGTPHFKKWRRYREEFFRRSMQPGAHHV
ncbi:hypothetical protein [Planotetraspora mira]|uniref:Uncharacterized protein n=1 Tax=Planotetraspora mira TaxID=58121 RepID=A0A8J3XBE9_9ACTN|nr:hypothetical protein [Planotetraspora mira]GII34144.1 hypothetical protein Pmi06nite_75860 [Planotetraspora mira]